MLIEITKKQQEIILEALGCKLGIVTYGNVFEESPLRLRGYKADKRKKTIKEINELIHLIAFN